MTRLITILALASAALCLSAAGQDQSTKPTSAELSRDETPGKAVMRTAADPLKRLILELGGKSPCVVFADAELDDAIPSSV